MEPPAARPLDARVAYCLTTHACGLVPLAALSYCASTVAGPPVAVQQCVAAAGADCVRARACLYDASHPSLCAFGGAPTCDGNIALSCDQQTTTTSQSDCSLEGLQCVVGTSQALCALGRCSAGPDDSFCGGASGQVAARCARPFVVGEDCAAEGARCTPPDVDAGASAAPAHCTGTRELCIAAQCDDRHTLDLCLDGRRALSQCPTGTLCFPESAVLSRPRCLVDGQCDPVEHFDTCAATGILDYCHLGKVEHIDCRALGFAGCEGSPASGCVTALADAGIGPPLSDAPLP